MLRWGKGESKKITRDKLLSTRYLDVLNKKNDKIVKQFFKIKKTSNKDFIKILIKLSGHGLKHIFIKGGIAK
jgi:hypothetical protein